MGKTSQVSSNSVILAFPLTFVPCVEALLSVPKEYGIIVESVASKIKFLVRTGMCTLKKLV